MAARLEMPSGIGRDAAVEAADQAAGWLPSFASALHRDARAPVNLTPIAGLERHLHRRQGASRCARRCSNATAKDGRHDLDDYGPDRRTDREAGQPPPSSTGDVRRAGDRPPTAPRS